MGETRIDPRDGEPPGRGIDYWFNEALQLREALASLRVAWNAHMERCELEPAGGVPSFEQVREWQKAPSPTASAELPESETGE